MFDCWRCRCVLYRWASPRRTPWSRSGRRSASGYSCAAWRTRWWWTPSEKRSQTSARDGCPPPRSSLSQTDVGCSWTPTSYHTSRSWFSATFKRCIRNSTENTINIRKYRFDCTDAVEWENEWVALQMKLNQCHNWWMMNWIILENDSIVFCRAAV